MFDVSANNKRIAKNTFILYIRMALVLLVTLYTSRILLKTLGFEDFGIYNVVAGIVVMFSFFNVSMSVSVQRFLSYALGQNNKEEFGKIFSASIQIHLLLALLIGLLAGILGNNILGALTIPSHRVEAAYWIFHFSIFSFLISICQTPFVASIMAYERMNIYAYIGVIEVCSKLGIVYLLQCGLWEDKLKLYGGLIFLVTILIASVYVIYSIISFSNCRHIYKCDKTTYLQILSFSSWNLFGACSNVVVSQGTNILLNIFFGPVVNAARGIAYQVNSALTSFAYNIQAAVNPQIVKLFATNNLIEMQKLTFRACRYCFYFLLILSFPIFYYSDLILHIWLDEVPDYASIFCKLIVLNSLIDVMSGPLSTVVQATGRIKSYQLLVSLVLFLNIPIAYVSLSSGAHPESVFIICIILSFFALYVRMFFVNRLLRIKYRVLFTNILKKVLVVSVAVIIVGQLIYLFLHEITGLSSIYSFLCFTILSLLANVLLVLSIGSDVEEREFIKRKIYRLLLR